MGLWPNQRLSAATMRHCRLVVGEVQRVDKAYRSGASAEGQDAIHYRGEQEPQCVGFSYVFSRMDKLLGFGHVA